MGRGTGVCANFSSCFLFFLFWAILSINSKAKKQRSGSENVLEKRVYWTLFCEDEKENKLQKSKVQGTQTYGKKGTKNWWIYVCIVVVERSELKMMADGMREECTFSTKGWTFCCIKTPSLLRIRTKLCTWMHQPLKYDSVMKGKKRQAYQVTHFLSFFQSVRRNVKVETSAKRSGVTRAHEVFRDKLFLQLFFNTTRQIFVR